jgi:hypothetical protein
MKVTGSFSARTSGRANLGWRRRRGASRSPRAPVRDCQRCATPSTSCWANTGLKAWFGSASSICPSAARASYARARERSSSPPTHRRGAGEMGGPSRRRGSVPLLLCRAYPTGADRTRLSVPASLRTRASIDQQRCRSSASRPERSSSRHRSDTRLVHGRCGRWCRGLVLLAWTGSSAEREASIAALAQLVRAGTTVPGRSSSRIRIRPTVR